MIMKSNIGLVDILGLRTGVKEPNFNYDFEMNYRACFWLWKVICMLNTQSAVQPYINRNIESI